MAGGHAHALYRHGDSVVHTLPAQVKVVAVLGFVIAVVATPREAIWAFVAYGGLAAFVLSRSRIPLRFVLVRLVVLIPFLVAAATLPFLAGGERWNGLSIEGLWALWNVAIKATLGLLASMTLAATTEAPDVVQGLERLRVPRAMTAIMGFMLRYLDVIVGEISRMRIAMRSRGYRPRWLGDVAAIGRGLGGVFVRSFERGERIHRSMVSRGYDGRMPTSSTAAVGARTWLVGTAVPLLAWVVAVSALVVR